MLSANEVCVLNYLQTLGMKPTTLNNIYINMPFHFYGQYRRKMRAILVSLYKKGYVEELKWNTFVLSTWSYAKKDI